MVTVKLDICHLEESKAYLVVDENVRKFLPPRILVYSTD